MQNSTLSKILEWNPCCGDEFICGYGGKLELLQIKDGNKVISKGYKEIYTDPRAVTPVVCTTVNWHPDSDNISKSVIAYGSSIGQVAALSWQTKEEVFQ